MSKSLDDRLKERAEEAARRSAEVSVDNDPGEGANGRQGAPGGRMAPREVPEPPAATPPPGATGPSPAQLDHMVGAAGGKYAVTVRQMEEAEQEWLQTVAYAHGLGHPADRIRGIALMKGVPDPFATD